VRDLYLARLPEAAARAVPDELVDGTCLVGDQAHIVRRLAACARAGVTAVSVVTLAPSLLRRLAELEWLCRLASTFSVAEPRRTA
jgi:hypothetical protein